MGSVKDIRSKAELDAAVLGPKPVVAVYFWREVWETYKLIDQVFSHLAVDFPHVLFLRVEVEKQQDISELYGVSSVPTFIFFKDGEIAETLEGSDPSILANKISKLAGTMDPNGPAAPASLGLAAGPTILESILEKYQTNN